MKITLVERLPDRLHIVSIVRGYVRWPRSTPKNRPFLVEPVAGDDIEWGARTAKWTPHRIHNRAKSKRLEIIKVHRLIALLAFLCGSALAQMPPALPAITIVHRPPPSTNAPKPVVLHWCSIWPSNVPYAPGWMMQVEWATNAAKPVWQTACWLPCDGQQGRGFVMSNTTYSSLFFRYKYVPSR